MGGFLYQVVQGVLSLVTWAIIAQVVMSWLIAFNVINTRHPFVYQIERFLEAVTRPVLWPIRKVIPAIGGIDITPMIALLIIWAAQDRLVPWLFSLLPGSLG